MKAGEIIRALRRQRSWTQAQLARAAGVTQSAVARWETGRVSPRVASLARLLEAAGLHARIELQAADDVDRDQLVERLSWSPGERLRYLTDMIAFEERARRATPVH